MNGVTETSSMQLQKGFLVLNNSTLKSASESSNGQFLNKLQQFLSSQDTTTKVETGNTDLLKFIKKLLTTLDGLKTEDKAATKNNLMTLIKQVLSEISNQQTKDVNGNLNFLNDPEIKSLLQELPNEVQNKLKDMLQDKKITDTNHLDSEDLVAMFAWIQQQQPTMFKEDKVLTIGSISSIKDVLQPSKVIQNHPLTQVNNQLEEDNKTKIGEKLQVLWKKVQSILNELQQASGQEKVNLEGKLLKISSEWAKLTNQLPKADQANIFKSLPVNGSNDGKQLAIWQQVIQVVQRRTALVNQSVYGQNATITTKDIAKWIQKAISNNEQESASSTKAPNPTLGSVNSMPMSKVEQYVIQVNQQGNSEEALQKNLMEEFQRVMKTSRFLQKNGTTEMSIKLKPVHLGDMMVKLTQMNGEMTVKITVNSQAAKDMLEGNLHQLKHMFSPHQVVVEKQEQSVVQQNFNPFTRNNQQQNQQEPHQQEQQLHWNEKKDEDEEQISFKDFLTMNQKV